MANDFSWRFQPAVEESEPLSPADAAEMAWDFVAAFPEAERPRAMTELLNALEGIYRDHGQPLPAWLHMVREHLPNREQCK